MLFIILFGVSSVGIALLIGWRAFELHGRKVSFHHVNAFQSEKEKLFKLLTRSRTASAKLFAALAEIVLRFMRTVRRALFAVERRLLAVKPTAGDLEMQMARSQGNASLFLRHIQAYKRGMKKGEIHE